MRQLLIYIILYGELVKDSNNTRESLLPHMGGRRSQLGLQVDLPLSPRSPCRERYVNRSKLHAVLSARRAGYYPEPQSPSPDSGSDMHHIGHN
jgi:hypothetical protein